MNDIDFKAWFYLKKVDAAVCVPAKCGGTSFYRWAFDVPDAVPPRDVRSFAVSVALSTGQGPFAPWEVVHYFYDSRKILAVRDPATRFASLWRDKCRVAPGTTVIPPANSARAFLLGMTPDELMTRIEDHPYGDPHWVPLQHYVVPGAKVVSYIDMGVRFGYADRTENATWRADDDPEYPVDRIVKHYAADHHLWITRRGQS